MTSSFLTLLITVILLLLYYKGKIDVAQLVVMGWASQTYSLSIGQTFTPAYLILQIITIEELYRLVHRRIKLSLRFSILIGLPILSTIGVIFVIAYSPGYFEDSRISVVSIASHPIIYYIRYYIPYFVLPIRIYNSEINIDSFLNFVRKIAITSCIIAILQLLMHIIFKNELLDELIGLKSMFVYSIGDLSFVRIQALFYEPKGLGAFLGIVLPLFLREKRFVLSALVTLVGILTLSQTFMIFGLLSTVVFVFCHRLISVRITVVVSLIIIITFFKILSFTKNHFVESASLYQEQVAYRIFAQRAMDRFALDDTDSNELLGIPLQRDLELPVVNFFKEHPALLLTGYGPLNNYLIPDRFFDGQWTFRARQEGTFKGHIDMGWLFFVFEMGIPSFVYIMFVVTDVNGSRFYRKYYSFILIALLFHRLEIYAIVIYALLQASWRNTHKRRIVDEYCYP